MLPPCFDRSPVQLWTARPNGELDYVNQTVLTYFGRTAEEMLRWGWADVVHADDLPIVGEKWSLSLEVKVPYEIEFRLLRHDGVYLWHKGRADPIRDGSGVLTQWAGANMNVHELIERPRR